jgi:Ser/Thr protein kinase RdoA (MazF antagonist)
VSEVLAAAERLLGARVTPLAGGYSGETFLVDLADGDATGAGQAVVRLFAGDPSRAAVTVGLLRLLSGLLPVPTVLDARLDTTGPAIGTGADGAGTDGPVMPTLIVMSKLPGERLDTVLATADDASAERLGVAVADVAVALAGVPFQRPGSLHGLDLRVEPWPRGGGPLTDAEQLIDAGFPGSADGLLAVADEAEDLIAGVARFCLVHADFNPKNLLVDPVGGVVTGLIDWEYAHAGAPVTDLGNMLRFDGAGPFGRAFETRFLDTAPSPGPEPVRTSRALDLISLIDLCRRELAGQGNVVTRQATGLLVRRAAERRL